MIGIVIPLKAKSVSRNWEITVNCLKRTLNSIFKQTSKEYVVVVIGHDFPEKDLLPQNERFNYIHYVKTQPPERTGNIQLDQLNFELDRTRKIRTGIDYLKKLNLSISFWFSLDADDLIRDDFVEKLFVLNTDFSYIFSHGYSLYSNEKLLYPEHEFFKYCGSSVVLSNNHMPNMIDIENEKKCRIPFCITSHVTIDSFFEKNNYNYKFLDEPLVCYIRESGDNISDEAYRLSRIDSFKAFVKKLIARFLNNKSIRRFT